jgi:hypothetical protein
LPIAGCILVLSPLSPRFAHRFGTRLVVGVGLLITAAGLASWASLSADSPYWPDLVWRSILMASGVALVMAPATESIMSSLPLGKAGVGSAVNDTTRQVGGALGVAIVGSVVASIYSSRMGDFLHGKPLPSGAAHEVEQSLGAALLVGDQVPGLAATAIDAFLNGFEVGMYVTAAVAFVGAVIALLWLPTRASHDAPADERAEATAVPDAAVVTSR